MKNILLWSVALCATLITCLSCGGGEEIIRTPLSVSTQSISTGVIGETKTITLDAPDSWYAATTGDKWIKITPSSGAAGKTEVQVTIKPNNGRTSRSAQITFKAGQESVSVKVDQAWSNYFTLPCKDYTIGALGGEIIIGGLPKTGFTITLSAAAQAWVKATSNVLTVSKNTGKESRNTIITITDNNAGKKYEVLLIQESAEGVTNILTLSELKIDDYYCPSDSYSSISDFFYSVDMDSPTTSRTVKLTYNGDGVEWITIGDNPTKIKSGDMVTFQNFTANTTIDIHSHNSVTDKTGLNQLIISGLPLVEIFTSSTIVDEPKVDCTFRLFDPKGRTDAEEKNLTFFESLGGIEYRGAGAQRYVKKPYNFKLRDSAGEKREAELLNIRNDNSWILDAMYLDIAHMRTRVCFDIWNEFNKPYYVDEKPKAMSGTRGHYVEVFINNEYKGLFILSDRIDRKQYQIEPNGGYIYKAKGWTPACLLRSCDTPSNSSYHWGSADIEQEYPDADDGGKPNFNYMAELIRFVGNSTKSEFSEKFEQWFDTNSVVDAFIFLNMIVADDNIGRNTFWIIRNVNEKKQFMHGLWDLDGSLGRNWDRHKEDPNQSWRYLSGWVVGHGNNDSGTTFNLHERIIKENPANIHQKIYDRWQEIKDGALSTANFAKKIEAYAELQYASGARAREVARWKSIDVSEQPKWNYEAVYYDNLNGEIAYMEDWWQKRHKKLDSLINSLEHE